MTALLILSLHCAIPEPIPFLASEGFHIARFDKATVAVPPGGNPEKRAKHLYTLYTDARERIQDRLQWSADISPLVIECANDQKFRLVVQGLAGGKLPEYAAAVAIPGREAIVLNRASYRPVEGPWPASTLTHETAHLFVHLRFKYVPRWIDEGLAMWASKERVPERQERSLHYWASRRGVIPFERLVNYFPKHHRKASFAYVQSKSLVTYLIERKGRAKLWQLLGLYQNMRLREAWLRVYGEKPEVTWERWRKVQAGKFNLLKFLLTQIHAFTFPAILFPLLLLLGYARYRAKRRRFYIEELKREEAEARSRGTSNTPADP